MEGIPCECNLKKSPHPGRNLCNNNPEEGVRLAQLDSFPEVVRLPVRCRSKIIYSSVPELLWLPIRCGCKIIFAGSGSDVTLISDRALGPDLALNQELGLTFSLSRYVPILLETLFFNKCIH